MASTVNGILQVIEYLDSTGRELVHRIPETGSGEFVLGSQCIVRESQVAIFFRDGKACDVLLPGRHTLTTLNLPILVHLEKIPFGSVSPFRAEVVFVNLKDFIDQTWFSLKPVSLRDPDFGIVRLSAQGKFAFQVALPQLFVNQIIGTRGLYATDDIVAYLNSILVTQFVDQLSEMKTSILDLPGQYTELGTGLRGHAADDFQALGLKLKAVYVTSVTVPTEVEKAIDERASMGAIGNMPAYMQFKAARALGDVANKPGGSVADAGVELGAGAALGAAMANMIQQILPATTHSNSTPEPSHDLPQYLDALKQIVHQQTTLSAEDKLAATMGLVALFGQLESPTATLDDVRAAHAQLVRQFAWLIMPLENIFHTPTLYSILGRITARSF